MNEDRWFKVYYCCDCDKEGKDYGKSYIRSNCLYCKSERIVMAKEGEEPDFKDPFRSALYPGMINMFWKSGFRGNKLWDMYLLMNKKHFNQIDWDLI